MSLVVKKIDDWDIIEIIYPEEVSPQMLDTALDELKKIANPEKVICLADCSKIKGGHSSVDLYNFLRKNTDLIKKHKIKEAIILPEEKAKPINVHLYELIAGCFGIKVNLFINRESALEWLQSPDEE